MATTTKAEMKIPEKDLHAVPLTLEGSSVLHQMFRFRWAEWRKLSPAQQHEIAARSFSRAAEDGKRRCRADRHVFPAGA